MEDEHVQQLNERYQNVRKQFGLWLFPAVIALGLALTLGGINIGRDPAASTDAIGIGVELVLAIALAYRVFIGKGWIAGPLLTILACVELAMKLAEGRGMNPGWIVFHLAIIYSLGKAAYDCWQIRRLEKAGYERVMLM